jgi:cell division septal protein FtsQ
MRSRRKRKRSKLRLIAKKKWLKTYLLFLFAAISLAMFSRWTISRGVFDIREVRIVGTRFSDPLEILEVVSPELEPDIFQDYREVSTMLQRMPLIKSVAVDRIPPDRIVIRVEEREPLAMLGGEVAQPVDEEGWLVPVSLSDFDIDLPIIEPSGEFTVNAVGRIESESILIALDFLKKLKNTNSFLLEDISVLSVEGNNMVRFTTVTRGFDVHISHDASIDEFYLLRDVIKDLEVKDREFCTIDMRYKDQVVVF